MSGYMDTSRGHQETVARPPARRRAPEGTRVPCSGAADMEHFGVQPMLVVGAGAAPLIAISSEGQPR